MDSEAPRIFSEKNHYSEQEIHDWLRTAISEQTGIPLDEIGINESFASYGLSSKDAIVLSGDLENWLGQKFSVFSLYEYTTIKALTDYLLNNLETPILDMTGVDYSSPAQEPIAIIGIGCRFPDADSPNEFWELLKHGKNAITDVPRERWDIDQLYDPDPLMPGKMNTRKGGFLNNIDQFDPHFFGISPREAACIDPQQRLLLEIAWEALEDAGSPPKQLINKNVGVFIGISNCDYLRIQEDSDNAEEPYAGTGSSLAISANRLSYVFGFNGPSMAIDTACSSSLVSVHLACRSLWSGESSLALVGGVNLILLPTISINFSKTGFLAPDGQVKAFDAQADGYVRGEGAGIVTLKLLSEAQKDGDQIYALIRGSAVNQDGKSNGLTAPNNQSQEDVIRMACKSAKILPGQVQYVEAHGSGTNLGDPIEAKALGNVMTIGRPPGTICYIGSVKTNIGHLESAAGIAGLIKVALSLKKQAIPPSLNFNTPNPHIPFDEIPVRVQQQLGKWPLSSVSKLAGVSAFGFGGTNAHVILEEAPVNNVPAPDVELAGAKILMLSANTLPALNSLAKKYHSLLLKTESGRDKVSLADICYNAAQRRSPLSFRLAVVAHSISSMAKKLDSFVQGVNDEGVYFTEKKQLVNPSIALVFSGQGSHWIGMGQNMLRQEPLFLEHIKKCDAIFSQYSDWSILGEITCDESHSRLEMTQVVQPVIFAIQVALARLIMAWGVQVSAVVGHSMGEIAAAHIAGILSLEDATKIIYHRSRLMQKTHGKGKMLATGLSLHEAEECIKSQTDTLSIAAVNSPDGTVISGTTSAIEELAQKLNRENVFSRIIQPEYAFHSPQMDSLINDFEASLGDIRPSSVSLQFFSTVREEMQAKSDFTSTYWVENMRNPVLFAKAMDQMILKGYNCFIEIGPQPSLVRPILTCFQHHDLKWPILSLMQKSTPDAAVNALAQLYTSLVDADWKKYYSNTHKFVNLPTYPWQRKRYWVEQSQPDNTLAVHDSFRQKTNGIHPLINKRVQMPLPEIIFESLLDTSSTPFLEDHQIYSTTIFPSTGYLEMTLIAAREAFGPGSYKISNLSINRALVLEEKATKKVQLIISKNNAAEISFKIFSLNNNEQKQADSWQLNTSGLITNTKTELNEERILDEARRSTYTTSLPVEEYYLQLRELGLEYGPFFQAINELWYKENMALARITLPEGLLTEVEKYEAHPVLLDACFQIVKAAIPKTISEKADDCYMPVSIDTFQVFEKLTSKIWCEAILKPVSDPKDYILRADILVYNDDGKLVARIEGLLLKPVSLELLQVSTRQNVEDWMYEVAWKTDIELEPDTQPLMSQGESWLIFSCREQIGSSLLAHAKELNVNCIPVYSGEKYSISEDGSIIIDPAVPAHFIRLFEDLKKMYPRPINKIIHLWSLDALFSKGNSVSSLRELQTMVCGSVLHLCQALSSTNLQLLPRLSLVTRGGQQVSFNHPPPMPWQTLLWGFGKVIPLDYPSLQCQRIDLDTKEDPEEADILLKEIISERFIDQVAFRNNTRYLPKIRKYSKNKGVDLKIPESENYQLGIGVKGILDNLAIESVKRKAPKENEVEIKIFASGLNFRDVMNTMGLYPGDAGALGYECAGIVTTVGAQVKGLKIGDEVVAVASGSFSGFVTTDAQLVVLKPQNITFSEAATIPIAFLTAYYTLNHLGNMSAGDRVLIHSATGGVGIAAIQLAQQAKAEIYATAGNPEKRNFLKSMGITHIMNSRSFDYSEEILTSTHGEGVDLVLNSLPGEYITKNLAALNDTGCYLEIGKTGVWTADQIAHVKKDVSYHLVDMSELFFSEPALIRSIFIKLMEEFEKGVLRPLPLQSFQMPKAVNAFRYMAQARHIGKVVITLQDQDSAGLDSTLPYTFSADATYLITGGTGGVGLNIAKWMIKEGVEHLVLTARKKPSKSIIKTLDEISVNGAQVKVLQADIANHSQMKSIFEEIHKSMPPLKGIINAAGVLEDGSFLKQDWEHFERPLIPKVEGTWNLHQLSVKLPLDFFVSFSSIASLLGSPHQANYAAANAFLDGMAHYRKANGLPAVTINWGPWSGAGMTAALNEAQRQRFKSIGMNLINPKVGVQILGKILREMPTQLAVLPIEIPTFFQQFSHDSYPAILSELYEEMVVENNSTKAPDRSESPLLQVLKSSVLDARKKILTDLITEQVIKVMRMDPLQSPDPHQGFFELGMDSLMAVELKNRIESNLGISLSVALTFDYPDISSLAGYLAEQIHMDEAPKPSIVEDNKENEERQNLISEIQDLSEKELESLINDELENG